MQIGNVLVTALIICLAAAMMLFIVNPAYLVVVADHSILFIIAAGIVGLVGAREKTPSEA